MTHDKKLLDVTYSFSPVSLKDAERFARLEKNLELVNLQDGEAYLPESFVDYHEWDQSDQTVSSAIRNSTPNDSAGGRRTPEHRLWIFGLKLSTPCV
jgi:hypothetical protein